MIRTEDFATEAELRELFSMEPDEELTSVHQTCSGIWRRQADGRFRFFAFEYPDDDEAGAIAVRDPSFFIVGLVAALAVIAVTVTRCETTAQAKCEATHSSDVCSYALR